jgi:hypothetical protein
MARQHMNMALLTRHMSSRRHKLGIVRTVRRVAAHAILANRRVFPEERATFFGMTAVTRIIDGSLREHLVPFAAMRIVARCAAYLHVALLGAEQMGRTLVHGFANTGMATKTSFLCCETCKQIFLRLRMVLAVARQATDVVSVVFSARPCKGVLVLRVALKARTVYVLCRHLVRADNVLSLPGLDVFFTICVAGLARRGTITFHKFGALAVGVRAKCIDVCLMAPFTTLTDFGLLDRLAGGL